MKIHKYSKVLAGFLTFLLVLGVGFVFAFGQFIAPHAGVTGEVSNTLLWVVVTAFGMAALGFSFWPVLGERPNLQRKVRHSGVTFCVATGVFAATTALAFGTRIAAQVPGAATTPPIDQVILPTVIAILGLGGLGLVAQGMFHLLEVSFLLYLEELATMRTSESTPD